MTLSRKTIGAEPKHSHLDRPLEDSELDVVSGGRPAQTAAESTNGLTQMLQQILAQLRGEGAHGTASTGGS